MRNLFIFLTICIFSICFGAVDHGEVKVIPVPPKNLYKIVSPEDWQKSQGQQVLETSSMDKDFIHLSTKEQLPHIAQKFWENKDHVILTLDTKKLKGRLIFETNPGGTTRYYHLYEGSIPFDAIVDASIIRLSF